MISKANAHPVVSDLYTIDDLAYIIQHPHVLGHLCGYTELTELHSDWIKYVFDTNDHTTLLAHRGSMKTSAMEIGCIRRLLTNPNDRIMYMRRSFTEAADIVQNIGKMMELPEIRELFRFAHGESWKYVKNRQDGIEFSFKKKPSKEPSIFPKGCEGGVTGTHCSKAIMDDIVALKSRTSEAERKHIEIVARDVYSSVIDPNHHVSLIGTRYHRDDYFSIAPKGPKFNCYDTGLLSEVQIAEKRGTESPIGFAAQYLLEIVTPEGAVFADVKEGKWVNAGVHRTRAHLDTAFGGGDYCALTIASELGSGTIQLIGFAYKGSINDWIPTVVNTLRKYKCRTIYVETNSDKGWSASILKKYDMNVKPYIESTNKVNKISTYLGECWSRIYVDTEVSDDVYVDMIATWEPDNKGYDDAPDSAASLCRECFTGIKASRANRYAK